MSRTPPFGTRPDREHGTRREREEERDRPRRGVSEVGGRGWQASEHASPQGRYPERTPCHLFRMGRMAGCRACGLVSSTRREEKMRLYRQFWMLWVLSLLNVTVANAADVTVTIPATYFNFLGTNIMKDYGGFEGFEGTGGIFEVISGSGCFDHGGGPNNKELFDHTYCGDNPIDPGTFYDGTGLNVFEDASTLQVLTINSPSAPKSFLTAAGKKYRFGFTDTDEGNDNGLNGKRWTITYRLDGPIPGEVSAPLLFLERTWIKTRNDSILFDGNPPVFVPAFSPTTITCTSRRKCTVRVEVSSELGQVTANLVQMRVKISGAGVEPNVEPNELIDVEATGNLAFNFFRVRTFTWMIKGVTQGNHIVSVEFGPDVAGSGAARNRTLTIAVYAQ